MKSTFKLGALALMIQLAGAAFAAPHNHGLDLPNYDPAVRAQDDLFLAANGGWLGRTEIPADKSSFGTFVLLRDMSDARVRAIVEELAKGKQAAGSNEFKIGTYYAAFVDTAAIDRAGFKPVQPHLKAIDGLKSVADLTRWIGQVQGEVATPIAMYVDADAKKPQENRLTLVQAGLGLPDRDYYLLKDDARMGDARKAYLAYLQQLAGFAGEKNAAAAAQRIYALEEKIAQLHWSNVENRDPVKTYNPLSVTELASQAPQLDWTVLFQAAGLPKLDTVSFMQPSAVQGIAKLLGEAPLADWKLYLKARTLDSYASVLPKALRDASFAFHGQALSGQKAELPRWQKGVAEVNMALGEAIGQIYVARHFPPEAKARMEKLVANLLAAYKDSIDGLSWMSPATKVQAQDKLSKYMTKIGYPESWRDYGRLVVKAGDALGNNQRAGRNEWLRMAAKADKPVDRKEWGMTPQTVNAYYNPSQNEIVFPAAILQPPFFDMNADDAVNYGAIGAVIGHEISHGFDDQGSQFDGDGVLRNWWTPEDRKAFDSITAQLVSQYNGYEPIPGKHVNGQLTLGENIADLSGLQIAFKAYQRSLAGQAAPAIGGYSGEQRFFLGWSQSWRVKAREQRLLQLLVIDPHSPGEYRANGAAINHDGFHQAFGTKQGDKMFKPSEERIRIW